MAALLLLLLLLLLGSGLGLEQSCLPLCSDGPGGSDCITVNRAGLDFDSAEQACRRKGGELLTLQSETDRRLFDRLPEVLPGSLWVGLRLRAGSCSRLSEPLRGYSWTSGGAERTGNWSAILWADSPQVCGPSCVALSKHRTWMERPCSDRPDGFLCRTAASSACWEQEVFFRSASRCSSAPCQQNCEDVKGGFRCSCFEGLIPDAGDPRRCTPHCPRQTCPPVCPRGPAGECYCADGFLKDEAACVDIDECDMNRCDQGCVNTFGSFWCFCRRGFVLKGDGKCLPAAAGADPVEVVKNATLGSSSSAPARAFLWVWAMVAVVLAVAVILIRLYVVRRQRRGETGSAHQSAESPAP